MVELTIIGLLVGAAMALRFTVFALVPAIIFILAVIAMAGVVGGETVWWIVGAMAVVSIRISGCGHPAGHPAWPISPGNP